MDRGDRNGAMWASHPTIPLSMPAALPPPFTQGRLIGIKILDSLVKGAGCELVSRLRDLQTNRIPHIIFSVSTQHLPHPTAKEKAGDCSPAFFDLIRPGGIVGIKAAGAFCAGIVAYFLTALVNTTAACAGVGEYSEDVERFYLHLRSTITLFHVKFLL